MVDDYFIEVKVFQKKPYKEIGYKKLVAAFETDLTSKNKIIKFLKKIMDLYNECFKGE